MNRDRTKQEQRDELYKVCSQREYVENHRYNYFSPSISDIKAEIEVGKKFITFLYIPEYDLSRKVHAMRLIDYLNAIKAFESWTLQSDIEYT